MIKAQVLVLCLCCVFFALPVAQAQSTNDIVNRINRLENDIQTLNRAFYRGEAPAAGPFAAPALGEEALNPNAQANVEIRLQSMEQELRALTGRVEEQGYVMNQLKMQMEALNGRVSAAEKPSTAPPAYAYHPSSVNTGNLQYVDPAGQAATNVVPSIPSTPPQNLVVPSQVVEQAVLNEASDISDPAALYEYAFGQLKAGEYDKAEASFQMFMENYPEHTLAPNATYWLGETFYVRNRYNDAAKLFAQSYAKYPDSSKSADNLLKLALSLGGMGKKEDACVALGQLKNQYPNGPANVLRRAEQETISLGCN